MRAIRIISYTVFLLLIGFAITLWIYSLTLSPQYDGDLKLPGLGAPVDVYYDEYGIPHIFGEKDSDVYYALGYVHAQDRLFQMDLLRRLGGGELSAFFGEATLEVDRLFHTLGIPEYAQSSAADFDRQSPGLQRIVKSYLRGVNHFAETGPEPLEYLIAGLPRKPFEVVDMYHTAGYMAFSFALGLRTDPLVEHMLQNLGPDYLNDLALHHYHEQALAPSGKNSLATLGFSADLLAKIDDLPVPLFLGSNNWVVAGSHTASGKPILANDTHIKYSQPSTWYEAHLEYSGNRLYGNFLAGIPLALIGHNNHSAWGITMFENDDTDFYFEEFHAEDEGKVRFQDSLWVDIIQREVHIKVKDGKTDTIVIRQTPHGPLMNAFFEQPIDQPVSLFWTYTKKENQLPEAFYQLNYAKSMADARQAVKQIHAPGLNIAYADTENNIALWSAAHLIERAAHVDSKRILNGASGADDPIGYYPFEANPQEENPESGMVYSANSQHDTTAFGVMHPGYYTTNIRMQRIAEFLRANDKWDVDAMKPLVCDDKSSGDAELAHHLYELLEEHASDEIRRFFEPFKSWRGDHQLESRIPVIYYPLVFHLLYETFADELGDEQFDLFLSTHLMKRSLYRTFYLEESVWFNDVRTHRMENKADIVVRAAQQAMDQLRAQYSNAVYPTWGKVHTIEFPHPLGAKKPLDKVFNVGPFPIRGTNESVNQQSFKQNKDGHYPVLHGPQMRILIDMAEMESSVSISPTGQSGNLLSEHYSDQAAMFVNCGFRPQRTNKDSITYNFIHYLKLKPE